MKILLRKKTVWMLLLFLTACSSLAWTFPQGKGSGRGAAVGQGEENERGRAFGADQEKMVRDWFSDRRNLAGLPPGLAKREQLPPGLQRQLQRNGQLPPGLQRQLQPLPAALEQLLPGLSPGLKRGVIGDNLVLIEETSQMVLDIISLFVE